MITDQINENFLHIIKNIITNSIGSDSLFLQSHGTLLLDLYKTELDNDSKFLKIIENEIITNKEPKKHFNFFGKILNKIINEINSNVDSNSISYYKIKNNFKTLLQSPIGKTIDEIGKLFISSVLSSLYLLNKNPNYKLDINTYNLKFNIQNELEKSLNFYIKTPDEINKVSLTQNYELKFKTELNNFIELKKNEYNYYQAKFKLDKDQNNFLEKSKELNLLKINKLLEIDSDLPIFNDMLLFRNYIINIFPNIIDKYINTKIPGWSYILWENKNYIDLLIKNSIEYLNLDFYTSNSLENIQIHINKKISENFILKEKLIFKCSSFFILNEDLNLFEPYYNEYLNNFRKPAYVVTELLLTKKINEELKIYSHKLKYSQKILDGIINNLNIDIFENFKL